MGTRRSVLLTDPQAAFLDREAERLDISVADLIRRIIDRHREAFDPKPVRQRETAE